MSAPWIAIIVTLAIFLICQIIASVWWASKTSTLVEVMQKALVEIATELKAMRSIYLTKEEFAERKAVSDKEHEAMWKQLDGEKGNIAVALKAFEKVHLATHHGELR